MSNIYFKSGLGLVAGLITTGFAAAQPMPAPSVGSTIPTEVHIDGGCLDPNKSVEQGKAIACFDDFSWRSFIAMNWPAIVGQRGTADTAKSFGDVTVPTVWDTWKADYEVFQNRETPPPTGWTSFEATTPCPGVTDNSTKILAAFSKFGGFNQAGFGVDFSPLVAQNKTYARFEVRMNKAQFDTIVNHEYYLASKLPDKDHPAVFNNNSIELKAAWREIRDDELAAARSRYYIVPALVLDPVANSCSPKNMGLIGLHIVQKTPTFPQWIWSSFEHIDKFPIPSSTQRTNAAYRNAIANTVWANYQLVITQWPLAPNQPSGNPFPNANNPSPVANSANAVMESYFQDIKPAPPSPAPATSCMGCHEFSRRRGGDFVWFMFLRAFEPPAAPAAAPIAKPPGITARNEAIEDLKQLLKPAN